MNSTITDQARAEHQAALAKIRELQKEQEWLQKRRGRFTASEFHRLMGYEDKDEFPKGAETYALDKAVESLTAESDSYTNESMERGSDKEVEGVEYFMDITGIEVIKYGKQQEFIELGKDVGATPDGIILPDGGIEGKAPNSKTHFFYLTNLKTIEDLKRHCKNYYWQMQGSMYVTGAKYWYFFSYDERFKDPKHRLFFMKVERNDEDIAKLKSRLLKAISTRNNYIKQL